MAHVWAWSMLGLVTELENGEVLTPETAIQQPLEHGARLVAGLDGFEGQVWREGSLDLSRWWPRPPDDNAWAAFLRADGKHSGPVPAPAEVDWRDQPWARPVASGQQALIRNERSMVVATGLLLTLTLGWQLSSVWQADRAVSRQQARLDQLEAETGGELTARENALAARDRAELLRDLLPSDNPLELLEQAGARIPTRTRLREWRQEGNQLLFVLLGEGEINAEQVVRTFEGMERLANVIADRGSTAAELEVRAEIVPGMSIDADGEGTE